MKIGIIGDGGHSKRIQKILIKKKLSFFIYKPEKPNYFGEKKFDQLKKCNVIFIISPNNTHYFYLKKLYFSFYGARRVVVQIFFSFKENSMRSCKRLGLPCQNS